MKIQPYIYLSGPLTSGNALTNTRKAIEFGVALWDAGYTIFIPHLNSFIEMFYERSYEHWMQNDLAWVDRCDFLVRLPGESRGSDQEVARALSSGKPVVFVPVGMTPEAFVGWLNNINLGKLINESKG